MSFPSDFSNIKNSNLLFEIELNNNNNNNNKINSYDNNFQDNTHKIQLIREEDIEIDFQQLELLALTAKNLSHRNIIKYFSFIIDNIQVTIQLQTLKSENSLLNYLQKINGHCLHEELARNFFLQILSAVSYLHSKNIIHSKINLTNIFILENYNGDNNNNNHLVILGDFMIKKKKEYLFEENDNLNSYYFYAPEIWQRREIKTSSDIWSLGILLYVMVIGKLPFTGRNKQEICLGIQQGLFVIPSKISVECKTLIVTLLTEDAEKRPTIDSLLKDSWILGNSRTRAFTYPNLQNASLPDVSEFYKNQISFPKSTSLPDLYNPISPSSPNFYYSSPNDFSFDSCESTNIFLNKQEDGQFKKGEKYYQNIGQFHQGKNFLNNRSHSSVRKKYWNKDNPNFVEKFFKYQKEKIKGNSWHSFSQNANPFDLSKTNSQKETKLKNEIFVGNENRNRINRSASFDFSISKDNKNSTKIKAFKTYSETKLDSKETEILLRAWISDKGLSDIKEIPILKPNIETKNDSKQFINNNFKKTLDEILDENSSHILKINSNSSSTNSSPQVEVNQAFSEFSINSPQEKHKIEIGNVNNYINSIDNNEFLDIENPIVILSNPTEIQQIHSTPPPPTPNCDMNDLEQFYYSELEPLFPFDTNDNEILF